MAFLDNRSPATVASFYAELDKIATKALASPDVRKDMRSSLVRMLPPLAGAVAGVAGGRAAFRRYGPKAFWPLAVLAGLTGSIGARKVQKAMADREDEVGAILNQLERR